MKSTYSFITSYAMALIAAILLTGMACTGKPQDATGDPVRNSTTIDQHDVRRGVDRQSTQRNNTPHNGFQRDGIRLSAEGFPLQYGTDQCAWSGKTLETVRYGALMVLADGSDLRFTSVENMVLYYLAMETPGEATELLAVDFAHGQRLLPTDRLLYLNSPNRPSPGDMFITPVDASNERMQRNIHDAYPGTYLTWDALLTHIQSR